MNQQRYNYWRQILVSSIDPTSTKTYFCSLRGMRQLFNPPQNELTEFKRAIRSISLGGWVTRHPHTYNWSKNGWFYVMPQFNEQWMGKALIIQQSIPSPYHCSICNKQLEYKRLYCSECAKAQQKKQAKNRYNSNRQSILATARKKYKKRKEEN